MPLALIVGAFGQGNPGDEALLDAAAATVSAAPGWDALVATARPTPTAARLGCATVTASAAAVALAAARADALVVAGGTTFKDLHPSTRRPAGSLLRRGLALAGAVRSRGKPVAMVGVGAAPVDPRRHGLVARLAAATDLLVLRDDRSAELLVSAGAVPPLRVGADLAWCAPALGRHGLRRPPGPPAGPPRLGVAVSHLANSGRGRTTDVAAALAAGLEPLAADGWAIELEPWQGPARLGADARIAHDVARRLGRTAIVCPPPADLAEAVARSWDRHAVVAQRFHALVAAGAAGTPTVAIAHEPKLAALAERLGQPALPPHATATGLAAAVEAAVAAGGPHPDAVDEEQRRSRATLDLLRLLLVGGGEPAGLEHLTLVPDPVPS